MPSVHNRKRRWLPLLQLSLAIGLITILLYRMDNREDILEALRSIGNRWPFAVLGTLCFLGCLTVSSKRWQMILAAMGMKTSFLQVLRLSFVGQFFNAFMLGALGGDAIKAYGVARRFPVKQTEAAASVFIDRMVGMLALFGIAVIAVVVRIDFFLRYPETQTIAAAIMLCVLVLAIVLLMVFRHNLFENSARFRKFEQTTRIGAVMSRLYRAFHTCLTHQGLLSKTLFLSAINHLFLILAAILLGAGLQIQTANDLPETASRGLQALAEAGNYLTVFPVINGISTIPITPGGLGTRDAAAQVLLGVEAFNVPESRAVTLSLLLYGVTLFWSLAGGMVYALSKNNHAIDYRRE